MIVTGFFIFVFILCKALDGTFDYGMFNSGNTEYVYVNNKDGLKPAPGSLLGCYFLV
jgi:hypothetical protein